MTREVWKNAVLCARSLLSRTDVPVMLFNETLHEACHRNVDLERPMYTDLNQMPVQIIPSLTASSLQG